MKKFEIARYRIISIQRILASNNARSLAGKRLQKLKACGRYNSAFTFIYNCIKHANRFSYKSVSYILQEHTGWLPKELEFEVAKEAFNLHSKMGNIIAEMNCLKRMSDIYQQSSNLSESGD